MENWYISPTASQNGIGTLDNPWNLSQINGNLNVNNIVQPGDSLLLRGGLYEFTGDPVKGLFPYLRGTEENPIILAPYPGEHVIFDGSVRFGNANTAQYSQYLIITNQKNSEFEFRKLNWTHYVASRGGYINTRWFDETGSHPPYNYHGGIYVYNGRDLIFRNLIVHDVLEFSAQAECPGSIDVYGCIFYNIGWIAPDRGHGHGVYLQNSPEEKPYNIEQTALFHVCGQPVANHGTSGVECNHIHFKNCLGISDTWEHNAGSPNGIDDISLDEIHMWGKYALQILASNNYAKSYSIKDSVFFTKTAPVPIQLAASSGDKTFVGNTVVIENPVSNVIDIHRRAVLPQQYLGTVDVNYYRRPNLSRNGYRICTDRTTCTAYSFSQYKALTGYDINSIDTTEYPVDKTYVYKNIYEEGRGLIILYNWSLENTKFVDISSLGYKIGDKYEIRLLWDYFNETGNSPFIAGTYDGNPIAIDMRADRWDYARMYGGSDEERAKWSPMPSGDNWSGPDYAEKHLPQRGAFIVRMTESAESNTAIDSQSIFLLSTQPIDVEKSLPIFTKGVDKSINTTPLFLKSVADTQKSLSIFMKSYFEGTTYNSIPIYLKGVEKYQEFEVELLLRGTMRIIREL